MSGRRLAAVLALLLLTGTTPRARASVEEFSTLDVARADEDDENALDHELLQMPGDWLAAWDRAPLAYRTAQGCVTSGQWVLFDDLKLQTATGRRSRLEVDLHREFDNDARFDWLQFDWSTPVPGLPGRFGGRFRPTYDKASQDFAGWWEFGDDSARVQVRTTFTIEDAFNELWSFRQARVGDRSEPYSKHPYEPALRVVWRTGDEAGPQRARAWNEGRGARLEVEGHWLTPSVKRVEAYGTEPAEDRTLWGAKGGGRATARAGRWGAELRAATVQADRSARVDPATQASVWWNRQWQTEVVGRFALDRIWTAELRWLYQERAEDVTSPAGQVRFRAVDRVPVAELSARFHRDWRARWGFMRDRATSRSEGPAAPFTFGDRFETRAYLGLAVRFGNVWLSGTEGIELDHEPYEVSFHHDKGLLQLQATF